SADYEGLRFNTMVARLMELTNLLMRYRGTAVAGNSDWDEAVRLLLLMLSPSAPHIGEDLWSRGVAAGLSQAEIERIVLGREKVQAALGGKAPDKVIHVGGRLVNLVVRGECGAGTCPPGLGAPCRCRGRQPARMSVLLSRGRDSEDPGRWRRLSGDADERDASTTGKTSLKVGVQGRRGPVAPLWALCASTTDIRVRLRWSGRTPRLAPARRPRPCGALGVGRPLRGCRRSSCRTTCGGRCARSRRRPSCSSRWRRRAAGRSCPRRGSARSPR